MIHLDTSFLIQSLVPDSPASVKLRKSLADGEVLGISSIAWSEFLCGPLTPTDQVLAKGLFATIEPFLVAGT